MSQVARNVAANYVGRACSIVSSIVFIPLYVRMMGLEASGLVGFGVIMLTVVQLMDMGLSTTLNREMARISSDSHDLGQAKHLVRTLEIVYWPIALLILITIPLLAPWIARSWIKTQMLPAASVQHAIMLMGVSLAIQWPYTLYEGGLIGLQKQVLVNSITASVAVLRTLGSLLVLWLVGRTVEVYFGWQIVISAASTLAVALCLWRSLPRTVSRPTFDKQILRSVSRFATGVMAFTITTAIISYADKIILSRMAPLAIFGCYTTALQISGMLVSGAGPMYTALFPKFVQLAGGNRESELSELYHRGCQMVSVLVIPCAVVLALFAADLTGVLETWTGRPLHIGHTDLLLMLISVGVAASALMYLPYALQLSAGWTNLATVQNVVTIAIQIPLTIWLCTRWGAVGAASAWMVVNCSYLFILVPLMHRRLLPGEARRWYIEDLGIPLIVSLSFAGIVRLCTIDGGPPLVVLLRIAATAAAAIAISVIAAPYTRQSAIQMLGRALRGRERRSVEV